MVLQEVTCYYPLLKMYEHIRNLQSIHFCEKLMHIFEKLYAAKKAQNNPVRTSFSWVTGTLFPISSVPVQTGH